MGWAEFKAVKNNYNDEFKQVDESILKLLLERKKKATGRRYFPSKELMEEWAEKYEMDLSEISWFFHSVNEGPHAFEQDGPGDLLNVVPIMKKTILGDFEYVLTHSMQHENGSLVTLEIKQIDKNKHFDIVRPHLMLEVSGTEVYQVRKHGSHGGGGETQIQYLVTPRLPDKIDEVAFAMMPYAMPFDFTPKEVILDKEVYF